MIKSPVNQNNNKKPDSLLKIKESPHPKEEKTEDDDFSNFVFGLH